MFQIKGVTDRQRAGERSGKKLTKTISSED